MTGSEAGVNVSRTHSRLTLTAALLEELDSRFGLVWLSHDGDQINVKCPFCQRRGMSEDMSGHLGINVRINMAHCVRCGWGNRNAFEWLGSKNVSFKVSVEDLTTGVDRLQSAVKGLAENAKMSYRAFSVDLPSGVKPMLRGQRDVFYESLKKKGLNDRLIVSNQVHYCEYGKYDGYVVFPFYEEDDVVYYQGRAAYPELLADPKRKKKNPKSSDGFGKNCWLYGLKLVKEATVYLVEGTLDQISLQDYLDRKVGDGHFSFALQGTSLSFPARDRHPLYSQWGRLAWLKPREVVVVFDPDATKKAEELAKVLNLSGLPARAARLLDGDPNEIASMPDGDAILERALKPVDQFETITKSLHAARF